MRTFIGFIGILLLISCFIELGIGFAKQDTYNLVCAIIDYYFAKQFLEVGAKDDK